MTRVIQGERIGRQGRIVLGCSATVMDGERRILLTRRVDNGQWCLPSGRVEPGESVAEACAREVLEETGLVVRVVGLIGVYSSPHRLVEYPDGNRFQVVGLSFWAEASGGRLGLSEETTSHGYFTAEQIAAMDILPSHVERIADVLAAEGAPFMR